MTHIELWNRIELTMECPPCIIDFDRRNGFAWWEDKIPIACPGVAVAMVGHKLDEKIVLRSYRAFLLDWEWSYLMHFEMAINCLFEGNINEYNYTQYFPYLRPVFIGWSDMDNYDKLKKLFI